MVMKHVLYGVILAPFCWGAPIAADERKEIHFSATYSGSAISTQGDTNHDGIKAGLGTVACNSNLGRCTAQGTGEAAFTDLATCPNGNAGFNFSVLPGTGHTFTRFEKTGDLLFTEVISETVCYDPSTQLQFKTGSHNITGGTGQFAGTTGNLQFQGTQWVLYFDADGNVFAAQSGKITGTIILSDD